MVHSIALIKLLWNTTKTHAASHYTYVDMPSIYATQILLKEAEITIIAVGSVRKGNLRTRGTKLSVGELAQVRALGKSKP